jgi:ABC-type transporter Mla subunit MlaD
MLQQTQEMLQQTQQMLQQTQQMLQQTQQMLQQTQQMLQQTQQMQHKVDQAVQPIAQMQLTLQQVQRDLASMRWTQVNAAIRFHNGNNHNAIRPLHKECAGGTYSVGALPPAHITFPENFSEAIALTGNQLDQLQDFYQFQFTGHLIGDRRHALWAYVSEPAVERSAA